MHLYEKPARHTTCNEGFEAARKAIRTGGQDVSVMSATGDATSVIRAAAFGTIDKPTHKDRLRIVDVKTGQIYSQQDGSYYPTGESATL